MGLDMYIVRKKNKSRGRQKVYDWETPSYRRYFKDGVEVDHAYWDIKGKKFVSYENKKIKYDTYIDTMEAAYWRKANHIHKWFVDNVQEGNDDCGDYRLTKEQLTSLYNTVVEVLENTTLVKGKVNNGYHYKKTIFGKMKKVYHKEDGLVIKNKKLCHKLLPTQDGFFFGNTDYDEYYYKDLEYTRDILYKMIMNYDFDKEEIYYRSSW